MGPLAGMMLGMMTATLLVMLAVEFAGSLLMMEVEFASVLLIDSVLARVVGTVEVSAATSVVGKGRQVVDVVRLLDRVLMLQNELR